MLYCVGLTSGCCALTEPDARLLGVFATEEADCKCSQGDSHFLADGSDFTTLPALSFWCRDDRCHLHLFDHPPRDRNSKLREALDGDAKKYPPYIIDTTERFPDIIRIKQGTYVHFLPSTESYRYRHQFSPHNKVPPVCEK